jgi:hypothetical protein
VFSLPKGLKKQVAVSANWAWVSPSG